MKRKVFLFLSIVALVALFATSCRSRQPHCPGVYSKVVTIDKNSQS